MGTVAVARLRRDFPGGWFILVGAVVCLTGVTWATDPKPLDAEQTARLIQALDHAEYAVRQAATAELAKAGAQALAPLQEALQTGSLERRVRLVNLIGRIYNAVDEASFDQAELALLAVSQEKSSSLRAQAQSYLKTNAEVRERMAVAAIRRLGGTVNYQLPNRIQGVIDPEQDTAAAPVLEYVMLTKDWKGGDDGLWHVRRLPQLRYLYRAKSAKVSEEAIQKLSDDLNLQVQTRGDAKLGIGNGGAIGGIEGCVVGVLTRQGAADKAGILQNDIITHFDNQRVKNFDELIARIGEKQPGDLVPVTVERNGEQIELKVELSGW